MTRDEIIEAMARAIHATAWGEGQWETAGESEYREMDAMARAALDALKQNIPGLSDVIDGKAVIVPVKVTDEAADGVWRAAYDAWAEFGARDEDAGHAAHGAVLIASPYARPTSDNGQRILDGLADVAAYTKGDTTRAKLVKVEKP